MTTTAQYEDEVLAGDGAAVRRLRLQIARIAPHFRIALLTGEPGAGKQAVARQIHQLSPASNGLFRSLDASDCTAGRGAETLYLRRVEQLGRTAQANLLRILKALHRETRIILSSEGDLKGMVASGRLRQDLYDLIGTLEIRVAPLRERQEDFAELAQALIGKAAASASFSAAALERLQDHGWPGNLAELWELCEQVACPGYTVGAANLPLPTQPTASATGTVRLEEVMQRHVLDVLESCSGNKLRAAELLGISRSTLYRMLDSQAASLN